MSDMNNQILANVSNSSDGSQESRSGSDTAGKSADDSGAAEHEDGPDDRRIRLEDSSDLYTIPDNIDNCFHASVVPTSLDAKEDLA